MKDIDYCTELNKVVFDYLNQVEKELNVNSIPYGDIQPGNSYNCWQLNSLGQAFRLPNDCDVFNLPPPTCGQVKEIQVDNSNKNKIIVRRLIGYTAASRIIEKNDPEYTKKALAPLILDMTMSLEKELGYSYQIPHHGNFATFKRPGDPFGMFRDIENYAAYEIRLYSDTFPAINLKKD